jgi:regulator of protease activity HflC (stomatin/prohibitin superfamily)
MDEFEFLEWICSPAIPILIGILALLFTYRNIKFVSVDEQLIIDELTTQSVINGPQTVIINPFTTKKFEVKKSLSLSPSEYCIIKNILSGEKYTQVGPKLVRLKAYDKILKDSLGNQKRDTLSLKANEYIRFIDNKTGKVRVIKGEKGCVVPNPNEQYLDVGGKKQALDLKVYEYVKVLNKKTGELRTERGEKLVFLGPFEEYVGATKQTAVEVDEETAVLVRNKRTGQQYLVTEKMLFVPSEDEEVTEVRKLIKLADYEACIVRDKSGKDKIYFGSNEEERCFFLPPYSELVELLWSRGRRRQRRDLRIKKLDLRPMFMSFEFNCRTKDNVELVLEGSFFWEVVDLSAMVRFTNDTTGDVCNHARSRFIELVSKVTLQEFMDKFNVIAKQVHEADSGDFYEKRGVKIHSLEVTGYHCAESSTAQILEQIIQETTNRMNKLQQQESENEVQLQEIKGDIEEEMARSELIAIQTKNSNAKSKMEGLAEAEKVTSFLSQLKKDFPDMDTKTQIMLWNTLRKEDALRTVSNGNATMYFTPKDVNLSIENHDHHRKESNWADDSVSSKSVD